MTNEILFALRHQNPRKILQNIRAMKTARAPVRGFVTITCFWTLLDVGLIDRLKQDGEIDIKRVSEEEDFDLMVLREICCYLERLGYMVLDEHRVVLTRKGRRFWSDTQGVLSIFFAYEEFFRNLPQ